MNRINPAKTTTIWHGQTREELERKVEDRKSQTGVTEGSEAAFAVSNMEDIALQDTLEDMSIALGNRLRGRQLLLDSAEEEKLNRDESLASLAEQLAGEKLDNLLESLRLTQGENNLLKMFNSGELNFTDAALLLAAEISAQPYGSQKRKRLSSDLDKLLEQRQAWALEIFSELELGTTSSSAMQRIIRQYSNSDGDEKPEGIWEWFNMIKDWPDRSRRIKVLMRTFAFELAAYQHHSVNVRLVNTLRQLKKLLLFLGIQDSARRLANLVSLTADDVLGEILLLIEQRWMYPEWLENRFNIIQLNSNKHALYLIRLNEIIKFLPDLCFLDEHHKSQLIETLEQYVHGLE